MPNMDEVKDIVRKEVIPSVAIGVVSSLAAQYVFGVSANINYLGVNMPASVAVGISTAGSNFTGAVIADIIRKSADPQMVDSIEMVLEPAVNGLVSYAGLYMISPRTDPVNAFLLGAGSTVAGKYAADVFNNFA